MATNPGNPGNPTDIDSLIDDEEGQYTDATSSSKFDLTVIHGGRHTLKDVSKNDSVATIIDLIKGEILNDQSKNIDITAGGVTLNSSNNLAYYGFPKSSARANKVDVVFRADGGSTNNKNNDDEKKVDSNSSVRVRKLDFNKFKTLKKSGKDDCIYGYMEGVECASMSCGCAMAPQTMYSYIKSIFDKYSTAYKITCPYHKKIEWDWDYCTEVADMTDDEYYEWCRKRDKRKFHNLKECPNCNNLCKRKEGVVIFRMNCEGCHGSDWCWECAQKWNNTGNIICGNKNCDLVTLINEELANAPPIQPTGFKSEVPSIRACPRCLTRMKWLSLCKHMKCEGCGKKFCFSCLALKSSDSKWPCNAHDFQCEIKPPQQFG